MIYSPATRLALQIAEEAHRGQTDSADFPCILLRARRGRGPSLIRRIRGGVNAPGETTID